MNIAFDILRHDNKQSDTPDKSELYTLFYQMQSGNLEARENIITHEIQRVIIIAKKISSRYNAYQELDDLIGSGLIGLIKGVDTFDLERNICFSTYADVCIKNEIITFLNKKKRNVTLNMDRSIKSGQGMGELNLEEMIEDNSIDIVADYERQEENDNIHQILEELPPRKRDIIKLFFGFDCPPCSQQEIANRLNLSQSYISRILKETLKELKIKLISSKKIEIIEKNREDSEKKPFFQDVTSPACLSFLEYLKVENPDALSDSEKRQLYENVEKKMKEFSSIEREIIRLFFGLGRNPYNMSQIARQVNLSQSRVSRILKKTVTEMKENLTTLNKSVETKLDVDKDKEKKLKKILAVKKNNHNQIYHKKRNL